MCRRGPDGVSRGPDSASVSQRPDNASIRRAREARTKPWGFPPPAGVPAMRRDAARRGASGLNALGEEREREREMRQRQAGASSITLCVGCDDPHHVDPSRTHAETNSLIETTRSLSQDKNPASAAEGRPQAARPVTRPYVCSIQALPSTTGQQVRTTIRMVRGSCQVPTQSGSSARPPYPWP